MRCVNFTPLFVFLSLLSAALGHDDEVMTRGLARSRVTKSRLSSAKSSSRTGLVVLFDGSQGSSYFIELLAQMEQVCVVGYEPLSEVQRLSPGDSAPVLQRMYALLYSDYTVHSSALLGLMDSQEHFAKCSGREAVFGLKARLGAPLVREMLLDPAFAATRFVLLSRNYLKQAVATLRRKDCGLGQFNLRIKLEQHAPAEEVQRFKTQQCSISPRPLLSLVAYYSRQSQALQAVSRDHPKRAFLQLSYEDITKQGVNVTYLMSSVVAPFLGVAATTKSDARPAGLEKASPALLCRSLLNFDEVCAAVKTGSSKQFLELLNVDACGGGSGADSRGKRNRKHKKKGVIKEATVATSTGATSNTSEGGEPLCCKRC